MMQNCDEVRAMTENGMLMVEGRGSSDTSWWMQYNHLHAPPREPGLSRCQPRHQPLLCDPEGRGTARGSVKYLSPPPSPPLPPARNVLRI
ncbi:hypothetical protein E2C01_065272 [Portunus trituberculatus]|uniref:Uncharacterized protein n=1 Tax=Portunus trituberculatus TaxID=210409 RepID=A0A5B7HMY8_PORTR|nr:hypothetical protein [Portunus trituberculatus]